MVLIIHLTSPCRSIRLDLTRLSDLTQANWVSHEHILVRLCR